MRRILSVAVFLSLSAGSAWALPAPGPAASPGHPKGIRFAFADVMKKQPYLVYPGVPSQMEVLWQLSATATSTLEWGTDTTYAGGSVQNTEYGTDHQHAYMVTGLATSTKYVYRVTTGGFVYRGSFVSAPDPGAQRLKFLAYGDTRTYPATHDQVAASMLAAMAADPGYQAMTLFMGDFVNTGNSETYWTNEYFAPAYTNIRALLANQPLQSCMGNHENSSPVLFTKYFPYPWVGGRYWSFDYGPIHVAVVDQYTTYTAGSAQLAWLASDLAASTKTWKFVLLHEPGWSSGNGHANNASVQALIEPLCEQYGVAILFAGHNHNYCRAVVNGVVHLTTGGGGAPLEAPLAGQPNVVISAMLNHFCKIAIDGGVLQLQAINSANGALIDSFTLVRAVPDRVAPVVSLLSPAGGEAWTAGSLQAITWTASDNVGVDSVNLDVSFGGGGGSWQPVAHRLPNTGSYTWTVPGQLTDSAWVRVTAFDHALNAASDSSDSLFRIVNPSAVPAVVPGSPLTLSCPRPNPARGHAMLGFSLPHAGRVRIEILDVSGRSVWREEADLQPGAHEWRWNGRGASGDGVEAGLYFVRLVTPWGSRTQRLVWMK